MIGWLRARIQRRRRGKMAVNIENLCRQAGHRPFSKLNIGEGVCRGTISTLRELSRRERSYKLPCPKAGFKPPEERL